MYTVIGHIHAQLPVSVSENFIFCFFRFMHVLPHVCMCTICAWSLQKLEDAVGALDLELEMVVSRHGGLETMVDPLEE